MEPITDPIKTIWIQGGYQSPNITLAVSKRTGEQYIVVDDSTTITRLMNLAGQIYMVASFRCQPTRDQTGREYYTCGDPIHPNFCSGYTRQSYRFVADNILPRLK